MATVSVPPQQPPQRIQLNVRWEDYLAFGEMLRDQPVRMTYSNGSLEIMTLSLEHERCKKLLGRMVEMLTLELDIDLHSGGSTTFHEEVLKLGLEPDESYWIQHEAQMRGKDTYDPESDPPPDLVLEVEISRSVKDRLKIYAALGVPEVWRYDGKVVHVLLLTAEEEYEAADTSQAFPMLPVAELPRFLDRRHVAGETRLIREFCDWVRQQQALNWGAKKPRGRKKK